MQSSTKYFQAPSKIINLQVFQNKTIAFATKSSGIRIMDLKDCEIKSNYLFEELHKDTTAVAFSHDAKIVAFANKNIIHVMILKTQQIIKTIKLIDGNVTLMSFDTSSNYIIVGTDTGRVLQYRYNSVMQIARLCSFPYHFPDEKTLKINNNFVSAFAFHNDTLACSGYGGSIYVINIHSRENTQIITRSRVEIQTLYFLDEDTLISGNIDGVLEIISLQDSKIIKRLHTSFIHIKNIVAMPSKEYLLVSSDKDYVSLINLKTLKIEDNKYLNFDHKIQKILPKNEESIFVILANNAVLSVELPNIKQLKNLIDNNELHNAYQLIMRAPMLKETQEYKRLENKYTEYMQKATKALIHNEIKIANEYTNLFKYISSKKDEINLLYITFKYYDKFKVLFNQDKYALAYSMTEKYPALKQTIEFQDMEKKWKSNFLNAHKQVLSNNNESARVLLHDYMSVQSKRPLIQFILHRNSELIHFINAIENKEFETISALIKENHFFANVSHYKALNDDMDISFQKSIALMNRGNTSLAKILIEPLKENPKYKDEVIQVFQACDTIEELNKEYSQDNLEKCYKLIDNNPFLKTIDLAIKLQEKWNVLVRECEELAIKGNIAEIKENLGNLLTLVSRQEKTGDLLRLAYRVKISQSINKKFLQDAKKYTSSYIHLFGVDKELRIIIKNYDNMFSTQITLTNLDMQSKPKDFWLYAK